MRKVKRITKHNHHQDPSGFRKLAKIIWQRRDLNPRPKAYESSALPLSYAAVYLDISYLPLF